MLLLMLKTLILSNENNLPDRHYALVIILFIDYGSYVLIFSSHHRY